VKNYRNKRNQEHPVMLMTIEGIYKDGKIRLLEQPLGFEEARVLVTLLPNARVPHVARKIGGLLADKVKLDPDTDPVREALDEVKVERVAHLRELGKVLDARAGS